MIMKGCMSCKNLEWFEEDSTSGFPGPNTGWGCNVRDIDDFKKFPVKRKLKCWEPLGMIKGEKQ